METSSKSPKAEESNRTAVVVLAGGKSSRMGRNKAFLADSGSRNKTLLSRALGIGLQCLEGDRESIGQLFLSGEYSDFELQQNRLSDCVLDEKNVIRDLYRGLGPLAGIHASLTLLSRRADCQFALFFPVDMPELDSQLLSQLIEHGSNAKPNELARCFADREFPLLLSVDEALIDTLEARLGGKITSKDQLSIRSFVKEISALGKVSILEPVGAHAQSFLNLNTPEEYQHWHNRL